MAPIRRLGSVVTLLLTLAAWVSGMTARVVHEHAVLHVVCAEHGEVMELGGKGSPTTRAVATTPGSASHDHGCEMAGLPSQAAVSSLVRVAVDVIGHTESEPAAPGDVGFSSASPLSYAPKTSPPRA